MGERRIINGAIYEKADDGTISLVGPAPAAPTMPSAVALPVNPVRAAREAQQDARAAEDQRLQRESAERSAAAAARSAGADERTASNQGVDNAMKLRSAYEGTPIVKEYRVGITQLGAALQRPADATGDNALIYDYAKAMDPGSVVRESEMGMAASGAPAYEAAAANLKKQFKIEGGGQLTPETREKLKREIATKVAAMNKAYSAQRIRYAKDAEAFGIDPRNITGDHDGDVFMPQIKEYGSGQRADNEVPDPTTGGAMKPDSAGRSSYDAKMSSQIDSLINAGASKATIDAVLKANKLPGIRAGDLVAAQRWIKANPGKPYFGSRIPTQDGYEQSILGQGMSGVNKGIASVVGGPVDLVTGAVNLGTTGINALANTDIPRIENPTLGSQWLKDNVLAPMGAIGPEANTAPGQIASRVGESIGAAAIPAAAAGSVGRAGGQLLAGATGGIGAAGAQQAFPGNPVAELLAEIAGGGLGAAGVARAAQRNAQRGIEAAVPSVEQLKEQASQLYRQAENRGVVAGPQQTQELADSFRAALTAEGNVSPTGRISDVYPKAKEAQQLIDDYAGNQMNPTQMQTVRRIAADGMSSPEPMERRLGKILTETFDEWGNPLAPELQEARDVSSRYLTAETLGRARELAGARASQFTGSGFENALRTEYRGLDRKEVKDQMIFSPDVLEAIQKVSRGTPASNFARGLGRLAPTGPVSGMGSAVPALAAGSFLTPGIGMAVGGTMAGAGIAGRAAATNMGIRAADEAELIARNGGALPQAEFATPEQMRLIRGLALAEAAKYQNQ